MQYSSLRKANEFLFKMRRFVCLYLYILYQMERFFAMLVTPAKILST